MHRSELCIFSSTFGRDDSISLSLSVSLSLSLAPTSTRAPGSCVFLFLSISLSLLCLLRLFSAELQLEELRSDGGDKGGSRCCQDCHVVLTSCALRWFCLAARRRDRRHTRRGEDIEERRRKRRHRGDRQIEPEIRNPRVEMTQMRAVT